jgi:hypothetical protein
MVTWGHGGATLGTGGGAGWLDAGGAGRLDAGSDGDGCFVIVRQKKETGVFFAFIISD